MGEVLVTINGRAFPLACADGEEPRIRRLGQYVDAKIAEFVETHGQIGEARLILLAAIVIADELSDTNDLYQRERTRPGATVNPTGGAPGNASPAADAAASGIRTLAERIESIAARLEST